MSNEHSPTIHTLGRQNRGSRGLLGRLRDRWAEQRRLEDHRRLEDDLRGL